MILTKNIETHSIASSGGLILETCNYGARMHRLFTKDRNDVFEDILLGCEDPNDYQLTDFCYFGATIGPFANRIAEARFSINNKVYLLDQNEKTNCLHGGTDAFHAEIWEITEKKSNLITYNFTAPDRYNGFPGPINCSVSYSFDEYERLIVSYEAKSKKVTHLNITHHPYFNLSSTGDTSIANHLLLINADSYLQITKKGIPVNKIHVKKDKAFDFTIAKKIGSDIHSQHPQLNIAKGYDHNFILRSRGLNAISAMVLDPYSGRKMTISTTEPGLQFFSGNIYKTVHKGKGKQSYEAQSGFCLEPQHFPNTPNRVDFPTTKILPGEVYRSQTIYEFDTVSEKF